MGLDLLPAFVLHNYEVHEWKHASAILKQDFPVEWADLCALLVEFRLQKSWITVGGGRKSKVSECIDSFFYQRGWVEKKFDTEIVVDGSANQPITHPQGGLFQKPSSHRNRVEQQRSVLRSGPQQLQTVV